MDKAKAYSPLRYPGGKAVLADFFKELIVFNGIKNGTYFELYAGGAGLSFELLFSNTVDKIVLNDADYHIFAFWKTVLFHPEELIESIKLCEVNLSEWHKQKHIYDNPKLYNEFEIGFSTFFLNRCNRSGILTKAGPIGGFSQSGKYKIDARFSKETQIQRINKIIARKEAIEISNLDTVLFMSENLLRLSNPTSITYLDPPYYNKGKSLYLNYYSHSDHIQLRNFLQNNRMLNWLVSYDDVDPIREMYSSFNTTKRTLQYSLQDKRVASEIFIYSDNIMIPLKV